MFDPHIDYAIEKDVALGRFILQKSSSTRRLSFISENKVLDLYYHYNNMLINDQWDYIQSGHYYAEIYQSTDKIQYNISIYLDMNNV